MSKYRIAVRVSRAPMEFKEGMGIGILADQVVIFSDEAFARLDEAARHHYIANSDAVVQLIQDSIELVVEKIDESSSEANGDSPEGSKHSSA